MKEDIRKVREAKKSFEKMSGDLDQALTRNAAASRIKGVRRKGLHVCVLTCCLAFAAC